jgi:hypothetical protein
MGQPCSKAAGALRIRLNDTLPSAAPEWRQSPAAIGKFFVISATLTDE